MVFGPLPTETSTKVNIEPAKCMDKVRLLLPMAKKCVVSGRIANFRMAQSLIRERFIEFSRMENTKLFATMTDIVGLTGPDNMSRTTEQRSPVDSISCISW